MLRTHSILLACAALCGIANAQPFTSPAGYLTLEGSSNHDYILFKYDEMRWQQLDDTSVGIAPTLVQRVSWRRDGTSAPDPTWVARTMDVEVVLSNSVPAAGVSVDFAGNYSGAPTTAFVMKPVNLPDWTQPPATTPAPFDLILQLDVPWVYTGQESFLWEVRTRNNTSGSDYGNDFQSVSGSKQSPNAGAAIGAGCIATGQSAAMALAGRLENQLTRFRLGYDLTNGPASTPAFVNIDAVNSNLSVPGLCATIVAVPTLTVPLGMTDATGAASVGLNVPQIPGLVGATIYAQGLAIDAGLGYGLALSNGRSNTFPTAPATPVGVTRVYGYRLPAGTMRAPSSWTGGIVTRFD
ncbi:MAG: hypothetical protein IPM29_00855 [Planctomycetes bacterium]|nr:hypothetical protein [Planctomycetota bacterium]